MHFPFHINYSQFNVALTSSFNSDYSFEYWMHIGIDQRERLKAE